MKRTVDPTSVRNTKRAKVAQTEDKKGSTEEDYACPITHSIMKDPVTTSDGHTYDRNSIERWFRNRTTSPLTNLPLADTSLTPNNALKLEIESFIEEEKKVILEKAEVVREYSYDNWVDLIKQLIPNLTTWVHERVREKKKLSKQLHALKKQKGCKKRRLKNQTSRFIRKKRSTEPSNKH